MSTLPEFIAEKAREAARFFDESSPFVEDTIEEVSTVCIREALNRACAIAGEVTAPNDAMGSPDGGMYEAGAQEAADRIKTQLIDSLDTPPTGHSQP